MNPRLELGTVVGNRWLDPTRKRDLKAASWNLTVHISTPIYGGERKRLALGRRTKIAAPTPKFAEINKK